MCEKENEIFDDNLSSTAQSREAGREDPLGSSNELISHAVPAGVDSRTFLMRRAVVGAAAVIAGRHISAQERHQRAVSPAPNLDPALNVVKAEKGPLMTTLDEFLT
jgi:L-serine dehydratase